MTNQAAVTKPSPPCPFCGEREHVRLLSAIGGQLITAQWYCEACNTYYEALRQEFDTC